MTHLNTGHRDAVEILAADRDTDNEIREVAAILVDRALERREFVVKALVASRRPHAQQHCRLRVDGRLESRDRVRRRAALDVGVETDRVPAARAWQIHAPLELARKVVVGFGRAVGPDVARVEALARGLRRGDGGQKADKLLEQHLRDWSSGRINS